MRRFSPIIDTKIYSVTGINGFRQCSLTRQQAIALARRMQVQMDDAGWSGKMRVYYCDGSEIQKSEWGEDNTESSAAAAGPSTGPDQNTAATSVKARK